MASSAQTYYNVIVVGGGLAGSVSAARAAEQASKVLLLDKANFTLGDGNSLMTAGNYFVGGTSPTAPPEEIFKRIMAAGIATPGLAGAFAQNCARALDWLKTSIGLDVSITENGEVAFEQKTSIWFAPHYRIDVGINILKKLRAFYYSHGGLGRVRTRATKLLVERRNGNAAVAGLEAEDCDGTKMQFKCGALILATGGFQANKEMLRKYVGPYADRCKLRGSPSAIGDGFKMAVDAGAKVVNLKYIYGHLIPLKALTDDRFWPNPRLDKLVERGILVNSLGKRFLDEGYGDIPLANDVSRLDDVRSTCLVFDKATWEQAYAAPNSYRSGSAPNPWLEENNADVYSAATISELAAKLGVDARNLENTVKTFNAACSDGSLQKLDVPRSNSPPALQAPFYGFKVVPGITLTMGGVLVNERAQVLDSSGERPIKGLYAAGDAMGGLMGGTPGGYTGGVSQAIVFGMLAGENAVMKED